MIGYLMGFLTGIGIASLAWLGFAWWYGARAEERDKQERGDRYWEWLQSSKETEGIAY